MNVPIQARDARLDKSQFGQAKQRELCSAGPESWRAKLRGLTLAALILASVVLLSPGTGEAMNAGGEGALLCLAGNLTRVAGAHLGGTTHRDRLGAEKTTTHRQLIAGKHYAYRTNRAG